MAAVLVLFFAAPAVNAQVSLTTLGVPYTQDFNTLPASGSATWTNNSTIPGWFHARTGTGTTIVANNGSSNAGNLYSYGTGTDTDRALGSVGSGNAAIGNLFWGVRLQNNTGATINQLTVSYVGEQWRNSAAAAQTITFSYLVGSPTVTGTLAEFQSAGVAVSSLDFTSPITGGTAGALDGNLAANRVVITFTITGLSIPNGTEVMLRWSDPDHTGADHGLGIDDLSVTPSGVVVDTAPSVSTTSPADNATGVAVNANLSITFNEAVNVGSTWFQIVCTSSGTRNVSDTAVSTGDNITFTINPNSDFTAGETCTVTVDDAQVSDQDASDPPDNMLLDHVFDFTIAAAAPTPIHTIQGSTPTGTGDAASPLNGNVVTTTGIVTLLKTTSNGGSGTASGFFLQAPDADWDADTNTSEGIFVFTSGVPTYTSSSTAVAVGDEVTVTGTVTEFFNMTEITSVTNIANVDTGNTLPTAVILDTTILDATESPTRPQLEKYEGMRMTGTLKSVAPNDNFFDVYTVLSSVSRPFREPGIEISDPIPSDPSSTASVPQWDENPERLKLDTNGRAGAPNNPYTSNVTFTNVAGPLDFSFSEYRVIPDTAPTASSNMSAVAVPVLNVNEFTVAGFNIENFDNDAAQRQKAALGIRDVMRSPAIIGVAEIFDLADLQALATEVNTITAGATNYVAYLQEADGTSGDSDQDVGYLVDSLRVQVNSVVAQELVGCVGTAATCNTFINPNTSAAELLNDRPPLILDANVDPAGANLRVLVVVNHLRSFIDIESTAANGSGTEGGRVRAKRKAQAEFLAALLNVLQTANPTALVISVGDYNAYEFSSGYDHSLSVIKGSPAADADIVVDASLDLVNPNLTNIIEDLPSSDRYTFIFAGTPQALDHVVVNTVARARNTRIAVARMNADFPEDPAATYKTNAAIPERNSDHDAPVAYFSLAAQQAAGSVIISEFRFRGPGFIGGPFASTLSQKTATPGIKTPTIIGPANQAEDEFIEIYNNSDSDITVSTTDGSAGWALVAADGATRFIIPNNTIIPARGHFLGVNTAGYSLANYGGPGAAAGNSVLLADGVTPAFGYTQDIPDASGIALFRTANSILFTEENRLDAAGYTGVPALYREGTGFPTGGAETTSNLEHTFFRTMTRATGGLPKDTGNNTADFFLADTAGTDFDPGPGATQRLGAPGPENLFSPINRTEEFGFASLDPSVSQEAVPNRQRSATAVPNGDFGTLTLRRTFTNNTGETLSRVRFRIVEISTFLSPGAPGFADLRALSSGDELIQTPGRGMVLVRGTTLEQPPFQSMGGGWNASLDVPSIGGDLPTAQAANASFDTATTGTIVLSKPLNNGEAVDVQFKLGVMQTGRFFFYLVIEPTVGSLVEVANQTK